MLFPSHSEHIEEIHGLVLQYEVLGRQLVLLALQIGHPCLLSYDDFSIEALSLVLAQELLVLLVQVEESCSKIVDIRIQDFVVLVEVVHQVFDEEQVIGLEG